MARGAVVLFILTCGFLPDGAAAVCTIPLQPTRTSFVTEVRIDGRGPFRFLVDTGTSVTVVSPAAGVQASRTVQAVSTTGPVEVREGTVESLRAGGAEVRSLPVVILDLPHFPSHGRIDGILGMNFVEGRSVLLDVRRRCLSVGIAGVSGGAAIAADEIAGRVAVRVDDLRLVLDSAASYPVLMTDRARRLASVEGTFEMTSAAGRSRARSGKLPVLRLGDVVLRDLAVALVEGADPREDGLLPLTMFSSVFIAADRKTVTLNGYAQ
jgi:predicted aspartyl protease